MKVRACSSRPVLNKCTLETLDFQVDPYIGCEHYCYYCYALNQAETDWTKEVLIYRDITNQLNDELSEIPPQTIYMGWEKDPYQPCEGECRQTRQALECLLAKGFSASTLTKSDLVLRDADLLQEMNDASVSVSVAFDDDSVRRRFEGNTIPTESRINALAELRRTGVRTSALICPVIPYITEVEPLIEELVPLTDRIWIYGLNIPDRSEENWKNVERILARDFANLREQIEKAIFSRDHPCWTKLRKNLLELQKDRQLNLNIRL